MDYKNELNSDDDFDCSNGYNENYGNGSSSNGQTRLSNPNGLSKAELRKTNKPIMEKRRRARINHCLNELKSLILEAMKKDPARHTKLEKADILEMTVKHLQSVQRQQLNMAIQTDPSVIHKFKTGFVECAEEVNRYVSQMDGIDVGVRQRLTNHLNNCANSLEQIGSMTNFNNGYRGNAMYCNNMNPTSIFPALPQDLNNNNNSSSGIGIGVGVGVGSVPSAAQLAHPTALGGLQLIPSRLPSGEFALIMPNSNAAPTAPFAWPQAATANAAATAHNTTPPLTMANPNHMNDYTQSFRMSAFSKLQPTTTSSKHTTPNNSIQQHYVSQQQSSTTTTSPPLSPVSSVSSHGDDSLIMHSSAAAEEQHHISAALAQKQTHSFAGVFSTPPPTSAETSFNSTHSLNSSTSSTHSVHLQQQQVSSTSGGNGGNGSSILDTSLNSSLKRERNEEADSSDSLSLHEPSAKKSAMSIGVAAAVEDPDSMWRPW